MTNRNPVALILNSAQSKYPLGGDQWVKSTRRAVDSLAAAGAILLCSVEPVMWDFVLYCAAQAGIPVKLLMPGPDCDECREEYSRLLGSFGIEECRAEPLFLNNGSRTVGKERWRERDRTALRWADVICPICIRPGGRLEQFLAAGGYNADFWQEFRIPWEQPDTAGRLPRYDFNGKRSKPFPPGDWLVHWSRASQGPWPDEPRSSFFSDMLAEPDRYVRSAGDTLARILSEKRLRGSSWMLANGASAVAFTALDPSGAFPLMRWRKRFVRYNFEPWGIAVSREAAIALGAREVTYADAPESAGRDKRFVHARGEKVDWSDEQEWRIPGDVDLSALPGGSYFAVVPDETDAVRIRERVGDREVGVHVLFG